MAHHEQAGGHLCLLQGSMRLAQSSLKACLVGLAVGGLPVGSLGLLRGLLHLQLEALALLQQMQLAGDGLGLQPLRVLLLQLSLVLRLRQLVRQPTCLLIHPARAAESAFLDEPDQPVLMKPAEISLLVVNFS